MNVTILLDVLESTERTIYRTKAFQRLLAKYDVSAFVSVYPRVPQSPSIHVLHGYRCIVTDATPLALRTLKHLAAESLVLPIPAGRIPGFDVLAALAVRSVEVDPALASGIAMTDCGTKFLEAARRVLLWLERNVQVDTGEKPLVDTPSEKITAVRRRRRRPRRR